MYVCTVQQLTVRTLQQMAIISTYLLILTDSTYDAPCSMILMLMLMLLYTVLTSNAQFCLNFLLLLSVFKARSNYNKLS